VDVEADREYSERFPDEMACRIELETNNGNVFYAEKQDYKGFKTNPASWDVLMEKYNNLTRNIDRDWAKQIATTIKNIENVNITDLTSLLEQINN